VEDEEVEERRALGDYDGGVLEAVPGDQEKGAGVEERGVGVGVSELKKTVIYQATMIKKRQ